jgi:hypothetical protein
MIPTSAPAFSLPRLHLENFSIRIQFISKTLPKHCQSGNKLKLQNEDLRNVASMHGNDTHYYDILVRKPEFVMHSIQFRSSLFLPTSHRIKAVMLVFSLYEPNYRTLLENRVLRRIFGTKRADVTGGCRKMHNEELHNLYSSPGITRIIKSRRMRRVEHVARMGEKVR